MLLRYGCRALFSQVNRELDDVFLGRAGSALHAETAFHDHVELFPDACPPNERFHFREAVRTAIMPREGVERRILRSPLAR